MILSKKRITKALIRLRGCAGWSAPLLFANPRWQVLSRRGPTIKKGVRLQNHIPCAACTTWNKVLIGLCQYACWNGPFFSNSSWNASIFLLHRHVLYFSWLKRALKYLVWLEDSSQCHFKGCCRHSILTIEVPITTAADENILYLGK